MSQEHPAMAVARASWSAVQSKQKEAWLRLMVDDVCIEDPIGVSPLDPSGKGHCGKAAVSAFWDRNIGPNQLRIEVARSFCAGSESAHLMKLVNRLPNGATLEVEGIFTYRVNEAGKLVALRGYWLTERDMKVVQPF